MNFSSPKPYVIDFLRREKPEADGPPVRPVDTLQSPVKPAFQSPYKKALAARSSTLKLRPDSDTDDDDFKLPDLKLLGLARKEPPSASQSVLEIGDSSDLFEEKENSLHKMSKGKDTQAPPLTAGSQSTVPLQPRVLDNPVATAPSFGQPSPIRNPLKKDKFAHLFNVPKKNQARPEHHGARSSQAPSSSHTPAAAKLLAQASLVGTAAAPIMIPSSPDVMQAPKIYGVPNSGRGPPGAFPMPISRPTNGPVQPSYQPPQPMYSSNSHWQPANRVAQFMTSQNTIDLTGREDGDEFDPNAALRDGSGGFGAPDPYMYIDANQANENIKNLLEGAFDDEEDKTQIRLPRRSKRPVRKEEDNTSKSLANKLEALNLKRGEVEKPKDDEDEDEEDDEGYVEGLDLRLLPHQVEGVAWMIDKETGQRKKNGVLPKGGILADDMGLGKTVQSLALILSNPRPDEEELSKQPKRKIAEDVGQGTLVVAPLALIKQWESEINTKVLKSHKLKVLVHHGQSRTKRSKDLEKYDVVITTYQIMASEHASSSDAPGGPRIGCFGVNWYRVILDEAHTIKNRNAKMTQACYAVKSHYRWCLTGTPMQNNLDELQSLIKFLQIKPYHDLRNWKDQITGPMKNGRGGLAMKRLQFFLKAFMKRRTKDILKKEGALNPGGKVKPGSRTSEFKIVARDVEVVVCDFDEQERRFYNNLATKAQDRLAEIMGGEKTDYIGALVLLLRLRQACNHWELSTYSIKKDKDALTTGSTSNAQSSISTPTKNKSTAGGDMDDLAAMLGGLSVKQQRKCDMCSFELSPGAVASGSLRCKDCDENLEAQRSAQKKHNKHTKRKHSKKSRKQREEQSPSCTHTFRNRKAILDSDDDDEEDESMVRTRPMKSGDARRARRAVLDSDDEEEEGSWLVPENDREPVNLGKAGGTDDENAEGGGEWLNSEDSETEDEDDSIVRRMKNTTLSRKAKSSDEDVEEEEDDDGDEDNDTESSTNDSGSDTDASGSEDNSVVMRKGEGKGMHITPSTKIRKLIDILHKETPEHKVIVFSQFTSMLDIVEPFLKQEGLKFSRYDGSMRNDLREASLQQLREDKYTRVLLCSLKCGSLGLNLTAASRVVILEPFWNPVSFMSSHYF